MQGVFFHPVTRCPKHLLRPDFLSRFIKFQSLAEMLTKCGLNSGKELVDNPPSDEFIGENSSFLSFADLVESARNEKIRQVKRELFE